VLPLQGLALFPIYAAAILLTGAALHYAVERPGLRLRDRIGVGFRRPGSDAAARQPA